MEISPNRNIEPPFGISVRQVKALTSQPPSDTTAFDSAEKLDQALQTAPAIRPEAVARARDLIGDVTYPPLETIQQIGALLAIHLAQAAGSTEATQS